MEESFGEFCAGFFLLVWFGLRGCWGREEAGRRGVVLMGCASSSRAKMEDLRLRMITWNAIYLDLSLLGFLA